MDALTVSVVLLWVAVIALGVLLWALSRQVGVLFERVAPMGALVTDAGPAVGSPSPSFTLRGIQSEPVSLGGPSDKPTLVFFLSPTCPVCKKLIPVLKAMVKDERQRLSIVLASDVTLYDTPGMLWPRITVPEHGYALAASGVVFTHAHCQMALCSPSRTSLMSGSFKCSAAVT